MEFLSAKQVEVGLPVCSDILSFAVFLLGQRMFLLTGATSQLTAPRANPLMLTATPP